MVLPRFGALVFLAVVQLIAQLMMAAVLAALIVLIIDDVRTGLLVALDGLSASFVAAALLVTLLGPLAGTRDLGIDPRRLMGIGRLLVRIGFGGLLVTLPCGTLALLSVVLIHYPGSENPVLFLVPYVFFPPSVGLYVIGFGSRLMKYSQIPTSGWVPPVIR